MPAGVADRLGQMPSAEPVYAVPVAVPLAAPLPQARPTQPAPLAFRDKLTDASGAFR